MSRTRQAETTRCGAERRSNGQPCRQPTDVWPCRYHDAAAFNALFDALTDAVRAAGGVAAFIRAHQVTRG